MKLPVYPTLVVLALSACSYDLHKTGMDQYLTAEGEDRLYLSEDAEKSVNILYMGTGNLLIENDGEAFLLDPFLSNPGLFDGRIQTNFSVYEAWKDRVQQAVDPAAVKAVLVAHSHYDHLMDLPVMLSDRFFPNLGTVYGNEYVAQMMANFATDGPEFKSLGPSEIFTNAKNDQAYQWQPVGEHIRFLPIETNHAPHALGVLLMAGKLKPGYFKTKLVDAGSATKRKQWKAGTSLAFLVDLRSGSDTLRLFIQTSGSKYPNGLPPASELREKKVDLAILCYANTPNVPDFPRYLLHGLRRDDLHPPVLMVHWENFFQQKPEEGPYRLVPFTSARKVQKRWTRVGYRGSLKEQIRMPLPGTLVRVWY